MQTLDISIALGVHYQHTENSTLGAYELKKKVASKLWNRKTKDYPLYSAYTCKILVCRNLKALISIIGAPNITESFICVFLSLSL